MSQEDQVIEVWLIKNDEKDYLVFGFDDEKKICLNEENCQEQLKELFSILLQELIKKPISLKYVEKNDYRVGLYKDVCKEYVTELNKEIMNVRRTLPREICASWTTSK